jgi:hypothetical protein
MNLFQIFYNAGPNGHWVIMGGSTAYVAGKAIAETWRPMWHALAYALLIGLTVRFIHFALFEEVLLSLRNYIVDCAILAAAAIAGYLLTRRRQMVSQYAVLKGEQQPR